MYFHNVIFVVSYKLPQFIYNYITSDLANFIFSSYKMRSLTLNHSITGLNILMLLAQFGRGMKPKPPSFLPDEGES